MCGIGGFWAEGGRDGVALDRIGRAMSDALVHRGPDDAGLWIDPEAHLVLSHRRLAVLDPSPDGAQPMHSASGRFVLVYNGEIYNHPDLRRRLEAEGRAPGWRGHSDTETLLAAIDAWGLSRTLDAVCGMYAIALWDRRERRLSLARDPMGEKPLYVAATPAGVVFASEIGAVLEAPAVGRRLDPAALRAFLNHGYVPDPMSIYADVRKLLPGHVCQFAAPSDPLVQVRGRHSFEDRVTARTTERPDADLAGLSRAMEACLGEVVASQMLSDVPLGSFLSGGVDSSLVTALMQSASDRPVRTFSIGFAEAEVDEAAHAEKVARHLGTDHTEIRVTEADALAIIPDLPMIYGEPFADSSQIPTALLCREARRSVTVALTGDGGDEVFGGYNRYLFAPRAWRHASRLPPVLRRRVGTLARLLHRLGGAENPLLRRAIRRAGLPEGTLGKIARLGETLAGADSLEALYLGLTRMGTEDGLLRRGYRAADREDEVHGLDKLAPVEWMMAMDSLRYLPGDILVKVDRAAMAASLETRAPLLDRRVVDAAWSLPQDARVSGAEGKRVLRDILGRHVPAHLTERPKQGFAIPLDRWLRGELRGWAEELLAEDRLDATGCLETPAVRDLWSAHLSGQRNEGARLWTVLMLMAWRDGADRAGGGVCRAAA